MAKVGVDLEIKRSYTEPDPFSCYIELLISLLPIFLWQRSHSADQSLMVNLNAFHALSFSFLNSLGNSPFCILSTSAYLSDFTPRLLLKSGKIQGSQSLCFFLGLKKSGRVHYLLRGRRVWSPVGGWSRWCQHMTLHDIESVPQGKSSSFSLDLSDYIEGSV